MVNTVWKRLRQKWVLEVVRRYGTAAFDSHTANVSSVHWLGCPVKQSPADIWTIQEIIQDRQVDFVVETGTFKGGSAFFIASLFDLMDRGHIVTIDINPRPQRPTHPRITYIDGSSTDVNVASQVYNLRSDHRAAEVLVLLDSDHGADHVLAELRTYGDLIAPNGYLIVQDGVIDELRRFNHLRPGPLIAISRFLAEDKRFRIDEERSSKFLFHYSPRGCLQRYR